ncbi:MAG: hypothetical protein PHN92_06145 [Geobacter sp.]|nr:hypothetical protein [Geobacter sp.]
MKDNLIFISERKSSRDTSQWIASYCWNAFITIRFGSDDQREGFSSALSFESADEKIPLAKSARQIHKHVFYPLERITEHTIGALGAIMPRTASEPRHAHYCLRLFKLPADPKEFEQAISSINEKLGRLRNPVCTSGSSVLLTPFHHDKHPYYIALEKNMMRIDALPDSYRPELFIPFLDEAA